MEGGHDGVQVHCRGRFITWTYLGQHLGGVYQAEQYSRQILNDTALACDCKDFALHWSKRLCILMGDTVLI